MRIYTSYFAKTRKIPEDIVRVSISLYPPKGYIGKEFKALAPTKEILQSWNRNPDEAKYAREYMHILDSMNPRDVYEQLFALTRGQDCVLLCFENSDSFCHRHLVSEWMRSAGYQVSEWTE